MNMASKQTIIFLIVLIQVALVLSKPYNDGVYHSDEEMEDMMYKREAVDCGSGSEPEGAFSRKCRSSCNSGERHTSMYDNKCSGLKCCMCHQSWGYFTGCTVE